MLPARDEPCGESGAARVAHDLRNEDAAGRGLGLQARGDVDAVAEQIAVLGVRHFAQVHAEAERRFALALAERDGGGQRIGGAGEFEHHAVAGGVEDAPAVLGARLRPRALAQARDVGDSAAPGRAPTAPNSRRCRRRR